MKDKRKLRIGIILMGFLLGLIISFVPARSIQVDNASYLRLGPTILMPYSLSAPGYCANIDYVAEEYMARGWPTASLEVFNDECRAFFPNAKKLYLGNLAINMISAASIVGLMGVGIISLKKWRNGNG